jgi:hypothetical protein
MSDPVFNVGDEVECEANAFCDTIPRWDHLIDEGGNGKVLVGKVTKVTAEHICVDLDGENWNWPNVAHAQYHSDQWNRPGYLKHKQAIQPMPNPCKDVFLKAWSDKPEPKIRQQSNPTRTQWLGRENTQSCECGAWVSGGLHSTWCCCSGGCK